MRYQIQLLFSIQQKMSVLEEQQCGVNQLLKCKLNYLQTQNTWMLKEYDYLCHLIELQKQIIHSSSEDLTSIHQRIQYVLNERSQYLSTLKNSEKNNKDMEIDQFIPLIYSFQEKIQKLQNQIKHREANLQTIQLSKGCEDLQKKSEIKCINSYQSHSRILERIKKEISLLKQKKCRLENDLIALNHKNQEQSTIFSSKGQSNKVVEEHTLNQASDDQSSVFEKVIMLIKKKRYQNSCLQQKAAKLKKSIDRKKAASNQLKRQIQGLQWNCLDGFVGACGFVDSGQVGDLSLVGKSFTNNNASFSFDVSRFIKPSSKRFRIPEM